MKLSTNPVKAYRVDFSYTAGAAIQIAAVSAEEASAGALAMLRGRVRDVRIVEVTDITEPTLSDELGPVDTVEFENKNKLN